MKMSTKIVMMLALLMAFMIPSAFAAVPENDTVNITLNIETAPNISSIVLNDDDWTGADNTMELVAGGDRRVTCMINATDYDDDINVSSIDVVVNFTGNPAAGVADPKYEYQFTYADAYADGVCFNQTEGSDWINYNCSVDVPYYAENGTWTCFATISDLSTGVPLTDSDNDTADISQLIALNVTTPDANNVINFGALAVGENSTDQSYNVSVENIGNVPISVDVNGHWNYTTPNDDSAAMTCAVGNITETDILMKDDGYVASLAGWTALNTGGFTTAPTMSLVEAVDATRVYNPIYFAVNLQNSVNPMGSCSGWLFFDVILG